jgi:uncharacterized membrane protein
MKKATLKFGLVLLMLAVSSAAAQAYVGPGLIIMGNFLGPFLLLVPFFLLLLILLLRWWFKKLKHQIKHKRNAGDERKAPEGENPDD